MSPAPVGFAVRAAARSVVAALLFAMTLQFSALSREDRENFWLKGSLCARGPAYDTAFAGARRALRPENWQRNVPSSER